MAKHPVPKKKTSKSKRDMRRSHHALLPFEQTLGILELKVGEPFGSAGRTGPGSGRRAGTRGAVR